MSTKKEIWRLLEPGVDVWKDGDELWIGGHWYAQSMDKSLFIDSGSITRRRMTLPESQGIEYGWQDVTADSPTVGDANDQGDVLWLRKGTMEKSWGRWNSKTYRAESTHWMMLPNDPPKDPDEEAFREWLNKEEQRHFWGAEAHEVCKLAFLAGRKSVTTEKEDSHE